MLSTSQGNQYALQSRGLLQQYTLHHLIQGITGTPALIICLRALILSPIKSMTLAEGTNKFNAHFLTHGRKF